MATIDGSIQLVKVVTDAELRQNGGSFVVAGRMAQPIQGFDTLTKRASGGNAIPVYVVSDAQIANGTFRLKGGSALPMADIDVVGANVKTIQGAAIPVYVVSGSLAGAGGAAEPSVTYLWRATFDDTAAAPLATPRAETIGESIVVQPDNLLSTDGSALVMSGTTTAKNYIVRSVGGVATGFAFQAGRIFQADAVWVAGAAWMQFSSIDSRSTLTFIGANRIDYRDELGSSAAVLITDGNSRTLAIVLRENGGEFVFDVTAEKLVWVSSTRSSNDRQAHLSSTSLGAYDVNWLEASVYDAPAGSPLLTEYGLATERIAAPINGSTITQEANALIEIWWVVQTNEILTLLFRRTDDDNCYKLVCDQAGTIKLFRREAGTDTELDAGKTQGWTNGSTYRITIEAVGTTIITRVNGARKHVATSQTFNQAATTGKVSSTLTPNISEWVSWRVNLANFPFL